MLRAVDGHEQSIAPARHCLDEARRRRRILERLAEPAHRRIQAVIEVDEGAVRPQALAEFLARDQPAGVFEERGQEHEGLVRQAAGDPVADQVSRPRVEQERTEANRAQRGSADVHLSAWATLHYTAGSPAEERPVTADVSTICPL